MNRIARLPLLTAALVATTISMVGCDKIGARMELNKGVEAYKAGKPETAINHFEEAEKKDPTLPMAKLYLATALAGTVIPGLDTPDNNKVAQKAVDTYQQVLASDPNDISSLKGVAGLYFSISKFSEAKEWQKKVLAVDPKDPEAAYTIGVIDYMLAHKKALTLLAAAGMQDDGAGNAKMSKSVCAQIQTENSPLVEEGLKYLLMADHNRVNYDDAMAYINLMYRRKADTECGNDAARKQDVALADEWREKVMPARKANEAKKEGPGGITMDSNGNMK
jgi:tetratricopeptide (TPR) repeat protein